MGHQDSHLELRALYAAQDGEPRHEPAVAAEAVEETAATPLAIDHDRVRSWRETARFFRQAA